MGFSSALLSLAALALARGAVAPRRTVPAGRVRAASAALPRPRYDKTPAELFEKAFAPYYIPPTVANARPDLVQKYQPESLSKVRGGRAKIRPKRMVVYVDGAKRSQRPPAGEWRRVAVAPKPVAPVEPKSTDADYYWKQAPIHNWGNTGFRGRMHAFLSPLATAIIDRTSYGGRDVRHEILKQIKGDGTVLDLCCGTGFSTAPGAVGVDATEEMVDVARFWHPGKLFRVGNAESYGEPFSFDVVTVMFATHEMPQAARRRVLRNAARIARKYVLIADIDPKYKLLLLQDPLRKAQATAFLAGEPYVPSYLKGMQEDVESVVNMRGGWSLSTFEQMTGHVKCWKLERANVLEGRPGAGPEPERFGV